MMIFSKIVPGIEELSNPSVREQVMNVLENDMKSNDPAVWVTAYSNLGLLYYAIGRYEKAIGCLLRVIQVREKVLKADSTHLAYSYNNLSVVYYKVGKYTEALKNQKKATFIFRKEKNHPYIIKAYNNLSSIYEALGEDEKSLKWKHKAERLRSMNLTQ